MYQPELLSAVFEHASDGIVVLDRRGSLRLVNPAACRIFGFSANELKSMDLRELIDGVEKPGTENLSLPFEKHRDYTGRKKDGSSLPLRLQLREFSDQGETFYAATIYDLTREKQVESSLAKAQSLNLVKSRLVSMASHEFRSPLSRIQLSASLIERYYQRLDKTRIMDHLQKIKLAVADMTDTLNDFLSVERIEAGNICAEHRLFDLVVLSEELTEQARLQAKPGQCITYRHAGPDQTVLLDRTLLRHCLVNLLSNAVKYSDEGGQIEFETETGAGGCSIRISDQGIGIPEPDQERLFEAFFRASNAAAIQGTGLGLNIVKNYTELMGGAVAVESSEAKGTTITLTFPKGDMGT